jgi:hypothetical protein
VRSDSSKILLLINKIFVDLKIIMWYNNTKSETCNFQRKEAELYVCTGEML